MIGAAYAHLGRRQDAIQSLEKYVEYARDDLQHPRAQRLLAELRTDQVAGGTH